MMTMITRSESFSNKLNSICRLCLKDEGPMSSIFATMSSSGSNHQDVLAARITSIAQVQICPTDGLPASICHTCRQQVDKFYDFRLLVEISDRKLRSCFNGEQEAPELGRVTLRSMRDTKNVGYEEFSVENTSDERDLLSVNAILVPSTSGVQVWQICNVAEEEIFAESRSEYSALQESSRMSTKLEYPGETDDSELDDYTGVQRSLAQGTTPITIKTVSEEDELYFTTTRTSLPPNDEQINSEGKIRLENTDDNDYEEKHLVTEEYSCQLCLSSFHSLEALKGHVSDHFLAGKRPNSSSIGSPNLGEEKIDTTSTREYKENSEGGRIDEVEDPAEPRYLDSLVCHSCDESFETMEERLHHAQRNFGAKSLKCRHCDESFPKQSLRNYHEENVHVSRTDKTHKCDECSKVFAKRSELRYHKGTHTNSTSTCNICNKHFRNVQSFKMHLKRHTLGSRYNCTECGKSYYTNSELARHVQQHTGMREYPCELCDMSFFSKPELNRHVKYHNGVKTFKCKVCFKTYYESGHLKVHERVHTGERPFTCTICEKGFITKSKMVRHFKTHERARIIKQDPLNDCEQYRFTK